MSVLHLFAFSKFAYINLIRQNISRFRVFPREITRTKVFFGENEKMILLIIFFSFLLFHSATGARVSASSERKGHHVFQEKAKKDPSLHPFSRADKVAIHEVIFAISQSNMEQLIQVLDDASDPSSSNYGGG